MMITADDLAIHSGTTLGKCYKVVKFLGEGGFGFETKCLNTETNEAVAIKVNKSHDDIVHQARQEIANLKKLQCLNPAFSLTKIISAITSNFLIKGCVITCVAHYVGLTMTELKPIIYQLATTLSHLGSTKFLHADLKPEIWLWTACSSFSESN